MISIISIKTSWIFTGSGIHWWLHCRYSLHPESSGEALAELLPAPQSARAQLRDLLMEILSGWSAFCSPCEGRAESPACSLASAGRAVLLPGAAPLFGRAVLPCSVPRRARGSSSFARPSPSPWHSWAVVMSCCWSLWGLARYSMGYSPSLGNDEAAVPQLIPPRHLSAPVDFHRH